MDRGTIIATLKGHEPALRQLGVASLSLFGSQARADATMDSDVDLAVTLTGSPESGLAHLSRLDDIKAAVADILGRRVDLVEEPAPSPRVQRSIERERVCAF